MKCDMNGIVVTLLKEKKENFAKCEMRYEWNCNKSFKGKKRKRL